MQEFNAADFTPEIKKEDLRISKTADPETYRAAAAQIIADIQAGFYPKADDPLNSRLHALAEQYKIAVQKLYALEIPETAIAEHEKIIQIAVSKEKILEKAADYEDDPVHALLALSLWEKIQ